MSLPKNPPNAPPAPGSSSEEVWIPVDRMVEEICRDLAAALAGGPIAVDCTAGLEIPSEERNRLRRALARLIVRTSAGFGTGGVEVAARPAGSASAPALLVAVQAISKERRTIRGGTGLDQEELSLARELIERGGGRVLITRQLLGERRSMFGFDVRWRLASRAALRVVPAPGAFGAPPGAQLSAAVASADSPPPPRNVAAEMPYSLSRW
jgi:hypothetical protein